MEVVIERGQKTFYEVGCALAEIRDDGLYKLSKGGKFKTFEAYCRAKWDFQRRHAYRLIDGAKVVDNVSDRTQIVPVNLEQTRPLSLLDADQQVEVWQKPSTPLPTVR